MACGNLLSGPDSNHRLDTTVYRPPEIFKSKEDQCNSVMLLQVGVVSANSAAKTRQGSHKASHEGLFFLPRLANPFPGHSLVRLNDQEPRKRVFRRGLCAKIYASLGSAETPGCQEYPGSS